MLKYLVALSFATVLIMGSAAFGTACSRTQARTAAQPVSQSPRALSLATLPADGYIELGPVNPVDLERLGLGGPSPASTPPHSPFNSFGMYWSEPFSVIAGDTLLVRVRSDSPLSWFGVDWSNLEVRGLLATTEVDEDGRSFNPQYPARSSVESGSTGYTLTVTYVARYDSQCVLVMKNANSEKSQQISMSVTSKSAFSLRSLIGSVPLLKNLVQTDRSESD